MDIKWLKVWLALLLFLSLITPALSQNVYKWKDDSGVVHFTDDAGTIPEKYRNQVERQNWWNVRDNLQSINEQNIKEAPKEEILQKEKVEFDTATATTFPDLCAERNYHIAKAQELFPHERNISIVFKMYHERYLTAEERARIPLTVTTNTDPCRKREVYRTDSKTSKIDEFRVINVIDGDTLLVEFQGRKESIRLIGIDTPESQYNPKARKDAERSAQDIRTIIAMGQKATAFTRSLTREGERLKIEFDVQQRDKYGRLLGYVYLSDGRMLNEEIVKAGYANPMTIPPNVRYEQRFLNAYREARENRRGLW